MIHVTTSAMSCGALNSEAEGELFTVPGFKTRGTQPCRQMRREAGSRCLSSAHAKYFKHLATSGNVFRNRAFSHAAFSE